MRRLEKLLGLAGLFAAIAVLAFHIPNPSTKVFIPVFCLSIGWAGLRRLPWAFFLMAFAAVYPGVVTALALPGGIKMAAALQETALQLGAFALVAFALWRTPASRGCWLAGGVLALSILGLLGEALGYRVQTWLPWHANIDENFTGLSYYDGGGYRFRGFSAEAGVLSTTLALSALLLGAALEVWKDASAARARLVRPLQGGVALVVLFCTGLVLTKSGLLVFAAILLGILLAVFLFGNLVQRVVLLAGSLFLLIGFALFVHESNTALAKYLRDQSRIVQNIRGELPSQTSSAKTRLVCWDLALAAGRDNPWGEGRYGLDRTVARHGEIELTPELEYYFSRGIFGLKSAAADILAQGGYVSAIAWLMAGMVLFVAPVWRVRRAGLSARPTAIVAFATGGGLLAGTFSAELFAYTGYWVLGGLLVHRYVQNTLAAADYAGSAAHTEPLPVDEPMLATAP